MFLVPIVLHLLSNQNWRSAWIGFMDANEQLLVLTVSRCSNRALLGPEMYTISRLTRYIAKQYPLPPLF